MKKQLSILFCSILSVVSLYACDNSYERYDNAHLYSVGDFTYATAQVFKIEIDWFGGSVEIQQGKGETLSACENVTTRNLTEKMRHFLDGNTLKIEYCSSGYKGKIDESEKNLQLEIPSGVELELETKNASVAIGAIDIKSLAIESDSGNVTGESWRVENNVEMETRSGYFALGELNARTFAFDSGSGDFSIEKLCVSQIEGETKKGNIKFGIIGNCVGELETMSGDVKLSLLEQTGLSVQFKSLTGNLKTERAYEKGERLLFGKADFKEKGWKIDVDTISGDLIVD